MNEKLTAKQIQAELNKMFRAVQDSQDSPDVVVVSQDMIASKIEEAYQRGREDARKELSDLIRGLQVTLNMQQKLYFDSPWWHEVCSIFRDINAILAK